MIRYLMATAILSLPLAAAAQSSERLSRWPASMARKQQMIMHGLPKPYQGLRDLSPDTSAKLRRGAAVFAQHCSACHGMMGQGAGQAAYAMDPVPADLEWLARTPKSRSGPYMYWTIAEGGRAFLSDMPPFKATLSSKDRWAVIAYIRAGFLRKMGSITE